MTINTTIPTWATSAKRDLLTGAPGAYSVGIGVSAVHGRFAGKEFAESIDSTPDDAYWRDKYSSPHYLNKALQCKLAPTGVGLLWSRFFAAIFLLVRVESLSPRTGGAL